MVLHSVTHPDICNNYIHDIYSAVIQKTSTVDVVIVLTINV